MHVVPMPELSSFFGIVIAIYGDEPHRTPHIHAYVGGKGDNAEYASSISIRGQRLLDGSLPRRYMKMVMAWMLIHEEELMEAWEDARSGKKPNKIAPLR